MWWQIYRGGCKIGERWQQRYLSIPVFSDGNKAFYLGKKQMDRFGQERSNRGICLFASHFLYVCISVSNKIEMGKDENPPKYLQR